MFRAGWTNATAFRVVPWLLVILACAGCGRVGQVAGKVTYRDKPVPDGTVMLLAGNGQAYDGKIQPDGTFLIRDVPVGTAKVSVTSMASTGEVDKTGNSKGDARAKQQSMTKGEPRSRIPSKYGDFAKSGLTVTVEKGATAQLDLNLK
jgi:hypothetical protein